MKTMKAAIKEMKRVVKFGAEHSRQIRLKIQASRGDAKHELWNEKRRKKYARRAELLAYAFLRGQAYRKVEPATRELPEVSSFFQDVAQRADVEDTQVDRYGIVRSIKLFDEREGCVVQITEAAVKAWLETGELKEQAA